MVREARRLVVLDPREERVPEEALPAPRLETLEGKVVGLLANGKPNSEELLDMVRGLLEERGPFRDVVLVRKDTHRWPASEETIQDLASRCDVVLTALAD